MKILLQNDDIFVEKFKLTTCIVYQKLSSNILFGVSSLHFQKTKLHFAPMTGKLHSQPQMAG